MAELRYPCHTCGKWTCGQCRWQRNGASARYTQHSCNRCGCTTGQLVPTMHTEKQWRGHNALTGDGRKVDWDVPLPEGYPFGARPEGELQTPFGTVTADRGLRVYEGVPVPVQGPYSQLDLKSWQRGVDDALKAVQAVRDEVLKDQWRKGYDAGFENAKEGSGE